VNNFDIAVNILLEIHCWKGYRKVGTKMKGGKRVNNCVPIKKEAVKEGLKNPKDNPCWKGYKPVGTKKKNGKIVPNCVPVKESENVNRYSIKVSVLPELRHLLGQFISVNSFPGKDPESVINKFVAKKIRDVKGPEDKIGLAIWYAKKYNPVVEIAPAVTTFDPAMRWDLNYEENQETNSTSAKEMSYLNFSLNYAPQISSMLNPGLGMFAKSIAIRQLARKLGITVIDIDDHLPVQLRK
jgi:hypothetical protein